MDSIADELAIQRLLTRYNRLVDDGRTADIPDLFTPNGRLRAMGQELEGRAALEGFYGAGPGPVDRPSTSHMISNIEIVIDGRRATSVSDFAVIARQADGVMAITMAGRYHDVFTRTEETSDDWCFAERRVLGHARPPAVS